jgi:hypothetical protein
VASDIHKKLVIGALGCGGLLAVIGVIGLIVSKDQFFKQGTLKQQTYTPDQAVEAWDTLSRLSVADSLAAPRLPAWSLSGPATAGTLVIGASRSGNNLPVFGDTFPAASSERKSWEQSAARVSVRRAGVKRDSIFAMPLVGPSAGFRLFQARALFAAALAWSNAGNLPDARLAMDSALGLAHAMQRSSALERLLVGARIERDAMDMLSRHTMLAGGAAAAKEVAGRVAPLDHHVTRLREVDRLLNAAGSNSANATDLGAWVADNSLPLALRTAAVRAIGLGWVFNATEPGLGVDTARTGTLRRLRETSVPDSVTVAIDRVIHEGDTFTSRIRVATLYRAERLFLDMP